MERLRSPGALVLAGLALMLGAGTCGVAEGVEDSAEQLAVSSLGLQLGLGALAFAGGAFSTRSAGLRLGLRAGRIAPLALGALILGTVALSYGLDGILQITNLRGDSVIADLDAELAGARGRVLFASLLGVGVAPGFGEELFCRGLIQRGLVERLGPRAGIAIASAFFGVLHGDPIHAAAAAVLGAYLGTVAWMADSTRASIACHVVNNLAAVSLAAFAWQTGITSVFSIAVGFGLAGIAIYWAWRCTGSPATSPGEFASH